jgi:hypothetical protein
MYAHIHTHTYIYMHTYTEQAASCCHVSPPAHGTTHTDMHAHIHTHTYTCIHIQNKLPLAAMYRRLRMEPRTQMRRSPIHNLGLFASADFDKNDMVIEYVGEVLREGVGEVVVLFAVCLCVKHVVLFFVCLCVNMIRPQ